MLVLEAKMDIKLDFFPMDLERLTKLQLICEAKEINFCFLVFNIGERLISSHTEGVRELVDYLEDIFGVYKD